MVLPILHKPKAKLKLNLTSSILPESITYSRASAATYRGSDGLRQTAADDVPRFEYGIRFNFCTDSENLAGTGWTPVQASLATGSASPIGTGTKVVENSLSTSAHAIRFNNFKAVPSETYTVSAWMKAGERSIATLLAFDTSTYSSAHIDLSTGTIVQAGTGLGSGVYIEDWGNGWYRCSLTFTLTSSPSNLYFDVRLSDNTTVDGLSNAGDSYLGDGVSGLEVDGFMLEKSSTLGEYIKSVNGIGSSTYPLGFLREGQATNLCTRSSELDHTDWTKARLGAVIANAAVSVDGATTADEIPEDTATGEHYTQQTRSATVGETYTWSIWAKQGTGDRNISLRTAIAATSNVVFDLSAGTATATNSTHLDAFGIEDWGNGWYRCWIAVTVASTDTLIYRIHIWHPDNGISYTGDGSSVYLEGGQLEENTFVTSYIEAAATTVSRAKDIAYVANASSFVNETEGTLYVHGTTLADSTTPANMTALQLDDGTGNERHLMRRTTSGSQRSYTVDGGSTQVDISQGIWTGESKLAYAYKLNDCAGCMNGGTVQTDTSATMPTGLDTLRIGANSGNSEEFYGHIKEVRYYNTRLLDAQLQEVTT